MTAQQLDAIKALAERFGKTLGHCDVLHQPHALPEGWVQVAIHRTTAPQSRDVVLVAGVSPAGEIHS